MSELILILSGVSLLAIGFVTKKSGIASDVFEDAKRLFDGTPTGVLSETPVPTQTPRIDGLEVMARTMWGEARNEGFDGMQAVANVIMNRYKAAQKSSAKARQFGSTIEEICKKPYQFSVWNKGDPNLKKMQAVDGSDRNFQQAISIADRALRGKMPDITNGADHYLNIAFTRQIRGGSLPSWVNLSKKTAEIGQHTFLRLA